MASPNFATYNTLNAHGVPNPNFPDPATDRIHRLPVVRLSPMLDLIELMSRLTAGRFRKGAQIVERAASEFYRLKIHYLNYTKVCIIRQALPSARIRLDRSALRN